MTPRTATSTKRLVRIAQRRQVDVPDQVAGTGLVLIGVEAPGPDGGLTAWCTLGPRFVSITENCFILTWGPEPPKSAVLSGCRRAL